jgi:hypothetical protein
MKARLYPVVLSLACGVAIFAAGRAADAESPPHIFVPADDPRVASFRQAGERAIDHAGNALVLEVRRVMTDTAPAMALGRLHLKDYKPPTSPKGLPVVTTIRRTSLLVRNPANAPDAADLAALTRIEEEIKNGDAVSNVLVQRVTLPGQTPEWRVYRPLVTLKQCTDCHGTPNALAPGVADALHVFYPADKAIDYRAGSWRGLIRASIPDTSAP